MRTKLFLVAAALAAGALFVFLVLLRGPAVIRPTEPHFAVLTVDFNNGTMRAFEGPVVANMTAAHALRASAIAGGFLLEIPSPPASEEIIIEGRKGWRAWRNGRELFGRLDTVLLQAGDTLFLRAKK